MSERAGRFPGMIARCSKADTIYSLQHSPWSREQSGTPLPNGLASFRESFQELTGNGLILEMECDEVRCFAAAPP